MWATEPKNHYKAIILPGKPIFSVELSVDFVWTITAGGVETCQSGEAIERMIKSSLLCIQRGWKISHECA